MYILMLTRGIPTKEEPIWGIFEMQQATALKNAGHKVVIGFIDERLKSKERFLCVFKSVGIHKKNNNGILVYDGFYMPRRFVKWMGTKKYFRFLEWQYEQLLKCIVKEIGVPDIIYSHYLQINYFAVNLHNKFCIPVVGVEHWSELQRPVIADYVKKMAQNTYHKLDKLICVSEPLRDIIKKNFGVEGVVVNNIVEIDYDKVSFMKEKSNKKNDQIKIVSVGRLAPQKKMDDLLRGLAQCTMPKKKWQLTIVGGGPLEASLKALTKVLRLEDNVIFTGMVSHEEVCRIMSESDFFALASGYETFGVVFIEAMSYGLPVLGTRCGGPETIINENNGLLVDNGDIDGLAKALDTMMKTYMYYSPEAIKAEVKAKYSPKAIVPKIEKVMKEAIEK